MDKFTGENLIEFIKHNDILKTLPIKYIFVELLKRNLIQPSEIIDAYSDFMHHKLMVIKSHYHEACVTALQMESGNFNKEDDKKDMLNRFLYNTSFSENFPNLIGRNMDEADKKKWSDFWLLTYGFRPEEERQGHERYISYQN